MTNPNPHRSTKKFRSLSNDQLRHIVSITDADPDLRDLGDIVGIMAHTGMRVSELKNLRWACVDLPNSQLVVDSPKTQRKRCIPIGAKTCEILQARRDREPAPDFVFGKDPLSLFSRASRQLRAAGDESGFGRLSFNVLRNTFFMRLVSYGTHISTVMFIGGYKHYSSLKSFLTQAQISKSAASDMARVEEQS
jgi:integrase